VNNDLSIEKEVPKKDWGYLSDTVHFVVKC